MNGPSIRPRRTSDLDVLARVFRDAIRHLGPSHYTPEQVRAWSSFTDDAAAFGAWLEKPETLVALDDTGTPVGFAGLHASGHIESLFVAPSAMRQGIGSALLARLLKKARDQGIAVLTTSASEFSRPVFEKFGFQVEEVEHTRFKNVAFTRYAMWGRP